MSIEATAISTTTTVKSTEASTSTTSASSATASKSFKDELETVKSQDAKTAEATNTANVEKSAEEIQSAQTNQKTEEDAALANGQKTAAENANKNQQLNGTNKTSATTLGNEENTDVLDPISELSSKISTINAIKQGSISTTKSVSSKLDEITDKNTYCQTIKMDNNDATFFLNLVENQQMSAQNTQTGAASSLTNNFTEIKTEATQQAVQVSQTLMDALNDASKTGKPVRIDFDENVAVIMKVDKNGTLSANFIPGDAAVENFLRNNIASLRQSFDDKGLPYNELSYSNQQNKQEQKQKNNKENEDE